MGNQHSRAEFSTSETPIPTFHSLSVSYLDAAVLPSGENPKRNYDAKPCSEILALWQYHQVSNGYVWWL